MIDPDTLLAAAQVHRHAGRLQEASDLYQRILTLRPGDPVSLHLLGTVAHEIGRSDIAVDLIGSAIRAAPTVPVYHKDLGEALRGLGRRAEAAAAFGRALDLDPAFGAAALNLALMLHQERQWPAAIEFYRLAAAAMPDSADVWMNLGCALLDAGDLPAAITALETARSLAPLDPVVTLNLGNARMGEDRVEDAAALYREALGRKPDYALAAVNLGRALRELGRPDEALAQYRAAATRAPELATARWNESSCRLLLGDYAGGWAGWGQRWAAGAVPPHGLTSTAWQGEPLAGRTLLVHAEQGLGDTLQFIRFLSLIRGAGKIELLVQPPLVRLLSANRIEAVADPAMLPPHDLRVPLLDLPMLFGTTIETLPSAPYLAPDPADLAAWQARLPAGPALRAGLVWRGHAAHANDRKRSIDATLLAPLTAVPDVVWSSLQQPVPATLPAGIAALPAPLADMADTAAAIAALDLVVTVDTAVAHLAGALGKPVWVLLPFAPDWRWLTGRSDSPWYGSARLFRQASPGDWRGVIDRVAAALLSARISAAAF